LDNNRREGIMIIVRIVFKGILGLEWQYQLQKPCRVSNGVGGLHVERRKDYRL